MVNIPVVPTLVGGRRGLHISSGKKAQNTMEKNRIPHRRFTVFRKYENV